MVYLGSAWLPLTSPWFSLQFGPISLLRPKDASTCVLHPLTRRVNSLPSWLRTETTGLPNEPMLGAIVTSQAAVTASSSRGAYGGPYGLGQRREDCVSPDPWVLMSHSALTLRLNF